MGNKLYACLPEPPPPPLHNIVVDLGVEEDQETEGHNAQD